MCVRACCLIYIFAHTGGLQNYIIAPAKGLKISCFAWKGGRARRGAQENSTSIHMWVRATNGVGVGVWEWHLYGTFHALLSFIVSQPTGPIPSPVILHLLTTSPGHKNKTLAAINVAEFLKVLQNVKCGQV